MEREEFASWSGFFDGEGHIELDYRNPTRSNPYGAYVFQVWINQWTKTPEVLFGELLNSFGGSLIISSKGSPYNFRWFISGKNARQFLEALLPYLRKKKRVAKLGIELQRRMQAYRNKRGSRRLPKSEIYARDEIIKQYNSLIEGNSPRRILKLGQYKLL